MQSNTASSTGDNTGSSTRGERLTAPRLGLARCRYFRVWLPNSLGSQLLQIQQHNLVYFASHFSDQLRLCWNGYRSWPAKLSLFLNRCFIDVGEDQIHWVGNRLKVHAADK